MVRTTPARYAAELAAYNFYGLAKIQFNRLTTLAEQYAYIEFARAFIASRLVTQIKG
jgi:hypothetical protein